MPSERRGRASGGDTVAAPTLADRTQLSWRGDQRVFRPERLHTAPDRRRQRDLWGSCDPHKFPLRRPSLVHGPRQAGAPHINNSLTRTTRSFLRARPSGGHRRGKLLQHAHVGFDQPVCRQMPTWPRQSPPCRAPRPHAHAPAAPGPTAPPPAPAQPPARPSSPAPPPHLRRRRVGGCAHGAACWRSLQPRIAGTPYRRPRVHSSHSPCVMRMSSDNEGAVGSRVNVTNLPPFHGHTSCLKCRFSIIRIRLRPGRGTSKATIT
jgi:hypothetical protein